MPNACPRKLVSSQIGESFPIEHPDREGSAEGFVAAPALPKKTYLCSWAQNSCLLSRKPGDPTLPIGRENWTLFVPTPLWFGISMAEEGCVIPQFPKALLLAWHLSTSKSKDLRGENSGESRRCPQASVWCHEHVVRLPPSWPAEASSVPVTGWPRTPDFRGTCLNL